MLRRRGNVIRDNEMTEILTYHNIANSMIDPWETSPSFFESEMEWLANQGYRGVSLKDFYKDIEQEKVVVLTFDDKLPKHNYIKIFHVTNNIDVMKRDGYVEGGVALDLSPDVTYVNLIITVEPR